MSVALEAAQLLIDYLTRGVVRFAVNMAAVDRAELDEVQPVRRPGPPARPACTPRWPRARSAGRDASTAATSPAAAPGCITAAFAAGLLESRLDQNVNIVNAELLAQRTRHRDRRADRRRRRAISARSFATDVRDRQEDATPPPARCSATSILRLVQLGPYHLDTFMDGIMLIFTHRDVPGMIGFIGTIFGKHKVNIAQMTVGRQAARRRGDRRAQPGQPAAGSRR